MATFREKYDAFCNGCDVPKWLRGFQMIWMFVVESSRTTAAFLFLLIISIYFLSVGIAYLGNNCGHSSVTLSISLIFIGFALLICSVYVPIYIRAKRNAEAARRNAPHRSREAIIIPLSPEEIDVHIPCRMNRISTFAFMFIFAFLPFVASRTLKMWGDHKQCVPLVFWTAFILTIVYIVSMVFVLILCTVLCCFMANGRERVPTSEEVEIP